MESNMASESSLTIISQDVYAARDSFELAKSNKSQNFEKEAGFAMQQLGKNEYSMGIAVAARQSVYDAVVNVAAMGVSLNPAKKQAYLVPRDGKICLDISYMGLMDLAQETGSVKWAQAMLVYETDKFELNGLDKAPTHVMNPFSTARGAIVGVYVTVKLSTGDYLTHTMTLADAYAIRDRSMSWSKTKKGPWLTDEGEMIKKTCVKQAYKYWPKTEQLENAINYLNENGEGLAQIIDNQPSAPIISAMPNAENINIQRMQIIEEVALNAIELHSADDIVGAYEEYIAITDNEEKIALWKKLPSNVRSAIKRHAESLKTSTGN
jgi:recombination protein RecT